MDQPPPPPRWKVALTVSFYIVAALSMVMANKWVLNKTTIPLLFLDLQLLLAVVLLLFMRLLKLPSFQFALSTRIDPAIAKTLSPMILLNMLGLTFNTYTLLLVDASFYQIARGLVLPLTVLTSAIFLRSRPSHLLLASCLVITLGFLIGVSPAQSASNRGFTPSGVLFGLLSCLTSAMHIVVIKSSLSAVHNSAIDLSYYSNLLTAFALMPAVVFMGEVPKAIDFFSNASGADLRRFIIGTLVTGFFGFMISVAGILSVKITSPITHMVSSAVRGVAQTVIAAWLFGEIISFSRAASVSVILAGSIWYTWIKHVESQQKNPSSSTASYTKLNQDDSEEREAEP